jgi:chemotaxis family two-component system sensor kinase Cph1
MEGDLDLTACDREPIRIPGTVQPHGTLLVLDRETLRVEQAGGACKAFFGIAAEATLGRAMAEFVGEPLSLALDDCDGQPTYVGAVHTSDGLELDAVAHIAGEKLVLELELAPKRHRPAAEMARIVESVGAAFLAAKSISDVCETAAVRFREITGFDRVMIYRFLPDETGSVVAEDKIDELAPFLNHRYPASDIPRQARELYLCNVIRVIPVASYIPSPLVTKDNAEPPLDMSDCHLRSVSPIHVQYLKNMGVGASCSISIIRDGTLWGLVACHHRSAKYLSFDERILCRLLASTLSHKIASLEDAEIYQARLRSRAAEDSLLSMFAREPAIEDALNSQLDGLLCVVRAHGIAVRRGGRVAFAGRCPCKADVLALADWLLSRPTQVPFTTDSLSREYAPASTFQDAGCGLLTVTISSNEPYQLLWFRAEQIEVINWAGNPHESVHLGDKPGSLTPRRSFDVWQETVRGRSEPWSPADTEAPERIARRVAEIQQSQSINKLNETLRTALDERDNLIAQKEDLLREGDHRIKNSLQILGSVLSMQLRETSNPIVRKQLEEALGRVNAVVSVHRRLHRSDQTQVVDVDIYAKELLADIANSLPEVWRQQLRGHTSPVQASAEVAMSIGLVLTELVLNAVKYAYGGGAGPIEVEVQGRGERLHLAVRDHGKGKSADSAGGNGFGSKLISRLVEGLQGTIERAGASPGLRVTVSVPIPAPPGAGRDSGDKPK